MPEQLTKHPDVTLQVLKSAGAKCGEGLPQEVLTACPAARFCKLPGGEVCIYGLPEAKTMTQIGAADWATLVPQAPPRPEPSAALPWAWIVPALFVGALLGWLLSRRKPPGLPADK
jgi:hypothetical protein